MACFTDRKYMNVKEISDDWKVSICFFVI